MKFTSIKARKLRHVFLKNENRLLVLSFVKNNKNLSNAIRWQASLLLSKQAKSSISKIKSRCFLSGRSKSYLKLFGLSRLKFRDLARNGKLPFVNKVSW